VYKYITIVSIITEEVLDGTPEHTTQRNQGGTNTQLKKSWKAAAFWDEECNRLIRRIKAVLLKLKEFPTRENVLSYKKEEAKAKSGIRKIKRDNLRNFVSQSTNS
jgi:hypothetical protein